MRFPTTVIVTTAEMETACELIREFRLSIVFPMDGIMKNLGEKAFMYIPCVIFVRSPTSIAWDPCSVVDADVPCWSAFTMTLHLD